MRTGGAADSLQSTTRRLLTILAFLVFVELDDLLLGESFQSHLDHAHRSVDDLGTGGHDGRSLLAPQHCLGNFGCIRQVTEPCFDNMDSGPVETCTQLTLKDSVDLLGAGSQGQGLLVIVFERVVGIGASKVTHCGLALNNDVLSIVVDIERGTGSVLDLPHDNGGNLDRITGLIVDFESVAVQVAGPKRDSLFCVEGVGPAEAVLFHRSLVCPEQDQDTRIVWVDDEKAQRKKDPHGEHDAHPDKASSAFFLNRPDQKVGRGRILNTNVIFFQYHKRGSMSSDSNERVRVPSSGYVWLTINVLLPEME